MEHAKKMILIEPRLLEQLQQQSEYKELLKPTENKARAVASTNARQILREEGVPDDVKAKLYQQSLNKMLNIKTKVPQTTKGKITWWSAPPPPPSPPPPPTPPPISSPRATRRTTRAATAVAAAAAAAAAAAEEAARRREQAIQLRSTADRSPSSRVYPYITTPPSRPTEKRRRMSWSLSPILRPHWEPW